MLSTTFGVDFSGGGYYDNRMGDEAFGARLKRLREASGLTQRELARRAGLGSHSSISQAEAGTAWFRPPSVDVTEALADALGVDHAVLLGRTSADRPVAESRAPYLSDWALLLRVGAEPATPEELAVVEEFAVSARRGDGNLVPQGYDDMRPRRGPRRPKPEPQIVKLRVSGSCMEPEVHDGEIVWFDRTLPCEPVAIVLAVRDEHEAHIKRLVTRDGAPWLESADGWAAPVDDRWRLLARAFTAQRRLL